MRSGSGVTIIAVSALLTLLIGCTQATGGGSPVANQTLVIDKTFDLKSADPAHMFDSTGQLIDHALYDPLLSYSNGDVTKPIPWVASSYTASSDARVYTFPLRHDVKFSDGTALTSADVAFSFNRLINLKENGSYVLDGITVSTPDPYTVVLTSSTPNPALPSIVTSPFLSILNSKVVKAHGGVDTQGADKTDQAQTFLDENSAGSGPYILQSFSIATEVVLKANTSYWGPAKPKFGKVVIRNVQTSASQLLSVQRGKNEIALDLSPADVKGLTSGQGVNVSYAAAANTIYMFLHLNPQVSTVTSNSHILNAVRYAIDYTGLVQLAGSGASVLPGLVPSIFLGALPASDALKTDVAKAKAEVSASGITKPSFTISYPTDYFVNGVGFKIIAEKVQADLATVGITVNLDGAPFITYVTPYRAGKRPAGLAVWAADYPDPADYLTFFPGGAVAKRVGLTAGSDPPLDAIVNQVLAEPDTARRAQLYQDIQRIMNQRSSFIPLVQTGQVVVASSNLTNTTFNITWELDLQAIDSK
ncbi:MAG TPA: ABC transporter substrate-binding protein [Chloroflexi bacterium]|jgi:peptide/nickel transport system substrate-binding protein|nr:ABC transporter substrate-binding protein [Chloroflexota bacterium]